MRHPHSRAERRWNAETWRAGQRALLKQWFGTSRLSSPGDYLGNRMWWARKQCAGHGNRCFCHYEKYSSKEIRKRRRALDAAIFDNVRSFEATAA